MPFDDDETIQWEEQEITMTSPDSILGEVKYANPPKSFRLRGKRYAYHRYSLTYGGERDGEKWHSVSPIDEPSVRFWVCEQRPGEFDQVFFPREIKKPDYVIQ